MGIGYLNMDPKQPMGLDLTYIHCCHGARLVATSRLVGFGKSTGEVDLRIVD